MRPVTGAVEVMIPGEYEKLFENKLFQEIMDNIDDVVMIIDRETYM